MRGALLLAVLLIVPLASAILVGIDPPEGTDNFSGQEIIIQSVEEPWNQKMWDDLENYGITPLRLLTPYELVAWNSINDGLKPPGVAIQESSSAQWRGGLVDYDTYSGKIWIIFEPNLPTSGAELLIWKFNQMGIDINSDLEKYGSLIPHRELIDIDSINFGVRELLNLDGVLWIEPELESNSRNVQAASLMGDGSISQPVQWSLGLNGTGVKLAIADSGVDYDHACFRNATSPGSYGSDGVNSTEAVGEFGIEHRKILFLNNSIDSADTMGHINFRHGTHTAGSLTCFDVYDYRNDTIPSNASAMAHNAQIIVQDIVSAEGWVPPDNVSELLSEAAFLGGIIHSNSWGDDTTEYTARSAEFDAWSALMPWSLAFIAPGNTGGALLEPANARNVVAVGASTKTADPGLWASSSVGPTGSGNYGIFVVAPGVSIQSARADGIEDSYNNDLRSSSGTSMSTPTAASFAGVVQQMVQDGWLMGANENTTAINVSEISPSWANLYDNTIRLGEGFIPSGPLLKSILSIATTQLSDGDNYTNRNYESGFGVLNLSELIDMNSVLSEVKLNDISPGDDIWIHDSFRLESNTPSQWLNQRSDGISALEDLIALPWDGSGAAGPFLSNGQNWTKRLVPNGDDVRITMSFASSPEPYLVEDLQLVVRTSDGYLTVGNHYDGDGMSKWYNDSIDLDDEILFHNQNETTVEIKFSSEDLVDIDWLDVEVRARYVSPGQNPGYTGMGGNKVGFALAVKGVIRDSLNWEDSDGDGFANIEDSCPNENPLQWDADNDGCIDDSDGDGIKDNIDICNNQDSTGYDLNQDGCIDDSDGDGIGDDLDLCETLVVDSVFPVDHLGCRPIDNPPVINHVIISGLDDSVWADSVTISWTIEDLDGDMFNTGARIMLHQNSSESSFFSIANCDFDEFANMSNEFTCTWLVPDDLPIFDITGKEMHIQIHTQSLNQSPESNIEPIYLDDDSIFTAEWTNPLLEEEEKKGMKDEDWSVTQRRALLWGVIGLIGVSILMARIWSTNILVLGAEFGGNNVKSSASDNNSVEGLESE